MKLDCGWKKGWGVLRYKFLITDVFADRSVLWLTGLLQYWADKHTHTPRLLLISLVHNRLKTAEVSSFKAVHLGVLYLWWRDVEGNFIYSIISIYLFFLNCVALNNHHNPTNNHYVTFILSHKIHFAESLIFFSKERENKLVTRPVPWKLSENISTWFCQKYSGGHRTAAWMMFISKVYFYRPSQYSYSCTACKSRDAVVVSV